MDVDRIIAEYLDSVAAGKVKGMGTPNWYRSMLRTFLKWTREHDKDPFTLSTFNGFLAYLKQAGYKPKTVRGHVVILRRLGKWLVAHGYTTQNPARELCYAADAKRVPRGIAENDVQRLLEMATHPRDRALILMLYESGARAQEIMELRWQDLDLSLGLAWVIGKGDKERPIYFKAAGQAALQAYQATVPHEPEDPVWWSLTTPPHPLTYSGLYLALKRLGKRAGVKKCHPHAFRHNFGRRATKKGCPTSGLQDLMGHASAETTRIYTYLDEDDLKDLHQRYT